MLQTSQEIEALASLLHVRESTAWCYLCQVVEHWPEESPLALAMVYPPLVPAFDTLSDTTGRLSDVMERLNQGPLEGDVEWRMVKDRFAHLRLVRMTRS